MAQVTRLVYQEDEKGFVPAYTVLGQLGNTVVRPACQEWADAADRIEKALNRRAPRQRSNPVGQAAHAASAPR